MEQLHCSMPTGRTSWISRCNMGGQYSIAAGA